VTSRQLNQSADGMADIGAFETSLHQEVEKQEAQLMLTNPRDTFRGQSRSPNSSIPYVRYSFLLCNSNFVFKARRFYDIRLQKMS